MGMVLFGAVLKVIKAFIQLGFVLYNQLGWSLGARFRQADVLGLHFFDKCSDLANAFDFVHTANVIHLYDEAHQESFLRALAFLVKPSGMIWGRQVGIDEDESMSGYRHPDGKGVRFICERISPVVVSSHKLGYSTGSI